MGIFNNILSDTRKNINIELGDILRINDAGEKIGSIFGDKWKKIGKEIDDATKNKTIRIDLKDDKKESFR